MKKNITICSLLFVLCFLGDVHAAITQWWLQPTVCRLSPTDCYSAMGAGFDSEMWDRTSRCWGLKLICPDALLNESSRAPQPMGRNEIKNDKGKKINPDFDTDLLGTDGDCFGRRKTKKNGTLAIVNGNEVPVWCSGILDTPDEILPNGEITLNAQPTCDELATRNYIAVENGKCYGKYIDTTKHFIECGISTEPTRIIILNGAENTPKNDKVPFDQDAADDKFDEMYKTSQAQREKYFSK